MTCHRRFRSGRLRDGVLGWESLSLPTATEQEDRPVCHSHLRGELMWGTRPRGSSAMRRAGMKAQTPDGVSPAQGEISGRILFCANLTVSHFIHPLGICLDVRGRTHPCRSGISHIPSVPGRPTSGRQNIVPGSGAEGQPRLHPASFQCGFLSPHPVPLALD